MAVLAISNRCALFFFNLTIKQMYYEDLLSVPFKLGGRTKDGMDCYGIVIEMTKRNGNALKDLSAVHVDGNEAQKQAEALNVCEIPEADAKTGDIVQCTWAGEIHIAFMLDKKSVIHATTSGVRITPLLALVNRKYFRVV